MANVVLQALEGDLQQPPRQAAALMDRLLLWQVRKNHDDDDLFVFFLQKSAPPPPLVVAGKSFVELKLEVNFYLGQHFVRYSRHFFTADNPIASSDRSSLLF